MPARPSTRTAIIQATFDALADVGLSGLALEDVAARAGVSRQTVYRHFGGRQALLEATIAREEERLLQVVAEATASSTDLVGALAAGLEALLRWTAEHPLLRRLLAAEPDALLPLLAAGDAPVLAAARPAIREVLAGRLPDGADHDTAADVLGRLMLSYAITPPEGEPGEVAGRLARLVAGGLAGPTGPTGPTG